MFGSGRRVFARAGSTDRSARARGLTSIETMKTHCSQRMISCSVVIAAFLSFQASAQLPTVPGHLVSVYVSKPCGSTAGSGLCPTTLAWASPTLAYCGRDIRYCGADVTDFAPAFIGKITVAGTTGTYGSFGAAKIDDPDVVCVDAAGKVAMAGSVLVGGRVPPVSGQEQGSRITAVQPGGSLRTILATPNQLWNPTAMAFDSAGRLLVCDGANLFASANSKIVRITKSSTGSVSMTTLFKAPGAPDNRFYDMAVAPEGIYAGDTRGTVKLYDYSGNVIRTLATGLPIPINVARAPGGFFGTDVFVLDGNNKLRRLTGSGSVIIGTGFGESPSLAFGPDGAMYVPEIRNNRILRIVPDDFSMVQPPDMLAVPNSPGVCGAPVTFTSPATSGGCAPVSVTCEPPSGSTFPVGRTVVTCTARDACGRSIVRQFAIEVQDIEPPRIEPHAPISVGTDAVTCSAVVPFTVSATDSCGLASLVCDPPSGSVFQKGDTTVRCTATDVHGLTAVSSFIVTVKDTGKPVILCPGDITRPAETGACTAKIDFAVTATDNCDDSVTVTVSHPSGTEFPRGPTTVTATARDAAGNEALCQFRVIVTTPDCNGNGLCDADDITSNRSRDCNENGLPDECEIRKATNVDLVFIVDTSPSMEDEAAALCGHFGDVLKDLAALGIQVNASFYGITELNPTRFPCLTGNVKSLLGAVVPGSTALKLDHYESWGPATSIVAARFNWRPDVTRVIVPISDEGAYRGDGIDSLDADALINACANASANDVIVCPVLGTSGGDVSLKWSMMQELAACTRGTAFHTSDPGSDLAHAIFRAIIHAGGFGDCNGNGLLDSCEIRAGALHDCNANGIPDECELAAGLLNDMNHNLVPDECEIIARQPVDLSTVELAQAVFSVVATGTGPFAYQWRKNGANLTDSTSMNGTRSETLQIASVRQADSGTYDVVVSAGAVSVTSRAARLTVSVYGDVTLDGTVTMTDVAKLLRACAGLESGQSFLTLGDVAPVPSGQPAGFGNGRLDLQDASRLARRVIGLDRNTPWK